MVQSWSSEYVAILCIIDSEMSDTWQNGSRQEEDNLVLENE